MSQIGICCWRRFYSQCSFSRALKKSLFDVVMSRRAIHTMNTLYPNATPADIQAGDSTCIICREEMITGCKKLPCNHIFHTLCLRSWFQRQQTCPTCRLDILRPRSAAAAAAARRPAQPDGAAAPHVHQQMLQPGRMHPQHFPQGFVPPGGEWSQTVRCQSINRSSKLIKAN